MRQEILMDLKAVAADPRAICSPSLPPLFPSPFPSAPSFISPVAWLYLSNFFKYTCMRTLQGVINFRYIPLIVGKTD